MNKLYLFAAMAAMLASCSENDLTAEKQVTAPQNAEEMAVAFDAYVNRGLTRAGQVGLTDISSLEKDPETKGGGFGVFGYYTDAEQYAGITKPNFMYNQLVKKGSTTWEYTPIKYWPNEFGSDAISDQVDRVSFFAYAPYVKVEPLTGVVSEKNTENITGMTRNNATGDPFIKYISTLDPTNTVDLCWGVAADNFTSSNSVTFPNSIEKGNPYLNLTKPGNARIKFDFKHALSKLNVTVNAFVNTDNSPSSDQLNAFTKIWVRSVKFEGIALKGQLNLRDGKWYAIDATGDNEITSGSVTVHDGLKDGKEPVGLATNETPASLNPKIIQSKPYAKMGVSPTEMVTTDKANVTGVTETEQNLFKFTTDKTDPIYVIPTGEPLKVTIVYDVETYDPNLAFYLSDGVTLGSTIQNTITKSIDVFGALKAGFGYTLNLHLGLRSVEFDAQVTDWGTSSTGDADLPSNKSSIPATSPVAEGSATIPANENTYSVIVTGLDPNETVSYTPTGSPAPDPAPSGNSTADAKGEVTLTATFAAFNTTTTKKSGDVQAQGTSGKGAKITVTQLPHALGLAYASATSTSITVTTSDELTDTYKNALTGAVITVYDVEDPTTNLYSGTTDGLKINTGTLEVGHTYIVTVKANDVTESFKKQIDSF